MTYFPKCFESLEQFEEWLRMARKSSPNSPFLSFCVDCTISYKRKMLEENRCEHPETQFKIFKNEDEELEDVGYYGS